MVAEKTLSDLQAGDKVVLRVGYVHATRKVVTVERVTDTQIIADNSRFKKDGGYRIGESRYSTPRRLLVATDDLLAEVELEQRHRTIHDFQFRVTGDQKELINEIYDFLKSKNLL